jgi:Zn-dependent peptidase ImmA (M78 family)
MTNINDTKKDDGALSEPQPGVALLTQLRRLMPIRRLAYYEHLLIAERQATRLLSLHNQVQPPVKLEWLSSGKLGNIEVVLESRWRMEGLSGMTSWADGHWVIGVNKGNPHVRRRFTLCHEFKHVLDAHRDRVTYQGITDHQRERIADYFAACYLVPKMILRQAWTRGLQDPEALAGLFQVSRQAMDKRLSYLQFIDSHPDRPTASYFRRQRDWIELVSVTTSATAGPQVIDGVPEDELPADKPVGVMRARAA